MKSASEYAIDRIRQLAPPTGDARRAMMDERLSPLAATMTTPNDPMLAAYDNWWQGLTGQGEGSGWFGMNTVPQEMARLQGVSDQYGGLSPEYLQAFGDSALMPGPGVMAGTVGKAGGVADALAGVADDLPMDDASRMARAREMGFDVDTPVYHGTSTDFAEFDPDRAIGTQFWSTTDRAAVEARDVGASGHGVVKELNHRIQNPAGWEEYDKFGIDELIARGYDGLALPDTNGHVTYVAFKPEQYRDVRARFDPRNINSRNLLASGLGGGVLGVGLLSNDAEAGQ